MAQLLERWTRDPAVVDSIRVQLSWGSKLPIFLIIDKEEKTGYNVQKYLKY